MNTQRSGDECGQDARFKSREAARVVMLGLLFVAALPLAAQDKKVAGNRI